ncbi:MAG: DsbA family protein [Synergistaceae bacterium]|nr:DsbA family protein [Synergistaceae bacterium]MDD4658207.1 DsbA family protein [Eubacteriales bacterium]
MEDRILEVTVYYDYICPWCYVGQTVAKRMQAELGAHLNWLPLLLHPETPPCGEEFSPEKKESLVETVARVTQMAEAGGLPVVFPGRMIYTRRALEATEYAREQHKLLPFHEVVFKKIFGEGKDIGSWEVLRSAAAEAGLNADEMQRMTESGAYSALIDAQTALAEQQGIDSLPTYILNDSYAVIGPQPYEVFQKVLEIMAEG